MVEWGGGRCRPVGHCLCMVYKLRYAPAAAPRQTCVYNGVPYHTGDTWDDGCDLRCRCEDETNNVYRCDQRYSSFLVSVAVLELRVRLDCRPCVWKV